MESIDGVIAFLGGRYREIERDLERRMKAAAEAQEFEQAALERNRLRAVRSLLERQRVANEAVGTLDAVAVAVDGADANAQVFQIRDGVLSDRQSFYLDNAPGADVGEVAQEFLMQYYGAATVDPAAGDRPADVEDLDVLAEALGERRAAKVEVRTAERGDKRRILELAERNALLALDQEKLKAERRRQQRVESLDGLQEALGLDALPLRIECFDISNLMGTHTVASMVVFEGGAPKKSDYRRFTIRGDDRGRARRLRGDGGGAGAAVRAVGDPAGPLAARPQAQRVVRDAAERDRDRRRPGSARGRPARAGGVPAARGGRRSRWPSGSRRCSCPGSATPIVLAHDTPALQLLQRVRDEAHRFAITHHRTRRDRAMTSSILDDLPGIGPARKRALLAHFGSPDAILSASSEELAGAPGVPAKVARDIWAYLHRTGA